MRMRGEKCTKTSARIRPGVAPCVCAMLLIVLWSQSTITSVSGKEHGFALLVQNAIKDFGFEYQMNLGRVYLQDILPVKSMMIQHVYENITEQTILNLADNGYDMFMFAQPNMLPHALKVAKARPDLYFGYIAFQPQFQNITNFKCFQMSSGQSTYLFGWLAGKMTKSNKVGYIGIASGTGVVPPVVSFAFGVQDANPDAEIHVWFKNNTLEPVATITGSLATRDMISRGCDALMVEEVRKDDTLTIDVQINHTDIVFFGNPVDLRYWLGDQAVTSCTFGWENHIRSMIDMVVNGTWYTSPFFFNGNIQNGKAKIMPLSPRVPKDIAAEFSQYKAKFLNNTLFPFCGKRAEVVITRGLKPEGPGGCLTADQFLTAITNYPDFIVNHGVMWLPSYQVLIDDALQAGLYVVCGVSALVCLVMILLIVLLRKRSVIHYSGWTFCILMCMAPIIIDVGAALLLPERSVSTCVAQIWLTAVGGALLVGVLFARQLRLAVIHWNSQKLQKGAVKNVHVAIISGSYLALNIIILILFTAIDTPDVTVHETGDDPDLDQYEWRYVCTLEDASTGCLIALIVLNGCVLLVACVLAVYARGMRIEVFDESNWMSMAVFSSAFAGGVGLLAWFTATGFIAKTLVAYAAIMITGNIALLWVMIPKFYCIIMKTPGSEHFTECDLSGTDVSGRSYKTNRGTSKESKDSVKASTSS